MQIYNIKDRLEFIEEVAILTQNEWGSKTKTEKEFKEKINKKIEKIKENLDKESYCKLVLVEDRTLIGFISIFEHDCEEKPNLSPWYATMFVKEEFRKKDIQKY